MLSSTRFARNLALSISGGALVTLLGATAAHADDLSDAGTTSDGAGAAHSGDATAVGNRSGSNTTQGTASGALGGLQVTNQNAAIANVGVAVADTGGNSATGNGSINNATGTQDAINALGPAVNSGTAHNGSNGAAYISTGNASAVGNESTTTIDQKAGAQGAVDGIVLINQTGAVLNAGVALSDTGGNTAYGNISESDAYVTQLAQAAAGLATNNGKASNDSDGKATISTGNASAVGNTSDTKLMQSGAGGADGDLPGLVIIGQVAPVVNVGLAQANTGGNTAVGNESLQNDDPVTGEDEGAGVIQNNPAFGFMPFVTGVVSNSAEASNWSGGTGSVATGDATATGNSSSTVVEQDADSVVEGPGALTVQATSVLNAGLATADTGDNEAVGNGSLSNSLATQNTDVGIEVIGVSTNQADVANSSDGTAHISTGNAVATGNTSRTHVVQEATAKGDVFNVLPQISGVQNLGLAAAETGDNLAEGNISFSDARPIQEVGSPSGGTVLGPVVLSQSLSAANSSDGSASIATGDASATGNDATTHLGQQLDPTGLFIPTQVADVVNAGAADANTGGNYAQGNGSDSLVDPVQTVDLGNNVAAPGPTFVGPLVGSNSADLSQASDGSAAITTGDADATGNESWTVLDQTSDAAIGGAGLVVGTQVALVANLGVGLADSGINEAYGNTSVSGDGGTDLYQDANVGGDNIAVGEPTTIVGPLGIVGSNTFEYATSSDGSASIDTGDATATGNRSATDLSQDAVGTIDGAGAVVNTQLGLVVNAGIGAAGSGGNDATGNAANSLQTVGQDASIGGDTPFVGDDTTVVGSHVIGSNSASLSSDSDGSASIRTGAAQATGNHSTTDLTQVTGGDVSGAGLVLGTQVGIVANVGGALALSGVNDAVGNTSDAYVEPHQDARIAAGQPAGVPTTIVAAGPVTASNSATAGNTSDGSAEVSTGGAAATGNWSSTTLAQDPEGSVDGMGVVLGTQVAGVANVGAAAAVSGFNLAVGNEAGSVDSADVDQYAGIASDAAGPASITIVAAGPIAASNTADVTNASDGHAKVKTGKATASGNRSSTDLVQNQSGNVSTMGLVIGTQVGGVANVGVGIANSGGNDAIGNTSGNFSAEATQDAAIAADGSVTPPSFVALGPVIASNSADVGNASDGEACVCTGDATASGNESATTFTQDLTLESSGVVLATEAGGVLNAGLGVANSGINTATGNASVNNSSLTQGSVIDDAITTPVVGPQIANNGGGAQNTSDGTAKIGTGNASGTGNQSLTTFGQAATIDSALAITPIVGGTANAGLGLANAGLNTATGNESVNESDLIQNADGSGLVSNQGEATNDSDGTAIIGNPEDCEDEVPGTETPGTPGLPRTGGPIEVEAALALMLLLAGFGLRRTARRLA